MRLVCLFLAVPVASACGDVKPVTDAATSDTTGQTDAPKVDAAIDASSANCRRFTFALSGSEEVPPVTTNATGNGVITLDASANTLTFNITFTNLTGESAAHIHGFAAIGANAAVLFSLPAGSPKTGMVTYTEAQEANILAGMTYVNIHTTANGGGEIRGQVDQPTACP